MATYYVDGASGNNSNNGTSSSTAFKTLYHACGALVNGESDTIVVLAGTYTLTASGPFGGNLVGGSHASPDDVTVKVAPGESVTFNGNGEAYLWGIHDGWTFQGEHTNKLVFTNCITGYFDSKRADNQVQGIRLVDCHFSGNVTTNCAIGAANMVEDETVARPFQIERCIFDGGWSSGSNPQKLAYSTTAGTKGHITSSLFRNWGDSGIKGAGIRVTNCTFVRCGMAANTLKGVNAFTVRNSIVANTGVWPRKNIFRKTTTGVYTNSTPASPMSESGYNISFGNNASDYLTTVTTNQRTKYWRGTGSLDTEAVMAWDFTNANKSGKYCLDFNRSPISGTITASSYIRDQYMVLPSLDTLGTASNGTTATPFSKHLTVSAWVKLHLPTAYSGTYGDHKNLAYSEYNVNCIMETLSDAHGHWQNEREDGWGLYAGREMYTFWVHGDPNNNDHSATPQDKYSAKFRLTGACDGGGGCGQNGENSGIDKLNWNWVVGVFDGSHASGNIKVYVNGIEGGSERPGSGFAGSKKTYTGGLSALSQTIYLGVDRTLNANSHLSAQVGDVAIWSSSLPAAAIRDIYSQFLSGGYPHDLTAHANAYTSSATLKAYWRMGGGTDSTIHGSGATWSVADKSPGALGVFTIQDESSGSNHISSSTRLGTECPWHYGQLIYGPMSYANSPHGIYHETALHRIFNGPAKHNYTLRVTRDDTLPGAAGKLGVQSGSNPAVWGGKWYRSAGESSTRIKYRDLDGNYFNCTNPSVGCYSYDPWVDIAGDYAISNSIKVEQAHTNLDNASQGGFVFKHFEQGPQWPVFTGSTSEGKGIAGSYNLFRLAVRGPMNLRRHNPCTTVSQPYSSSAG